MASRKINVGIIGTGWIGEIRAKVCANHPLVESVHIAEIDPAKLARVGEETRAKTATTDYRELLRQDDIDAIFVCSTPETTHYPITKDSLLARKHTLLEKPMGLALNEADEMMALAKKDGLKFTIGYTQRFNPKVRLRKEMPNGRNARDSSDRTGEPQRLSLYRQQNRRAHSPLPGRDGSDARHRLYPLVSRRHQAGAGIFRSRLPHHGENAWCPRLPVDHGHNGRRYRLHHRRGMGAAARLSALLNSDDRVRRH